MKVSTKFFSMENNSVMFYLHSWCQAGERRIHLGVAIPFFFRIYIGDMPDIVATSHRSGGIMLTEQSVLDFVAGPLKLTHHADERAKTMSITHWGETATYISGMTVKTRARFMKPVETPEWIITLDNGIVFGVPIANDPIHAIAGMIELGALMRGEEPQ